MFKDLKCERVERLANSKPAPVSLIVLILRFKLRSLSCVSLDSSSAIIPAPTSPILLSERFNDKNWMF